MGRTKAKTFKRARGTRESVADPRGLGEYEIAAEFHDLEEGKALCRNVGAIRMVDRLELVNVYIDFGPIRVSRAGRFDLIVFVNGQEVDQLSIAVDDTTTRGR